MLTNSATSPKHPSIQNPLRCSSKAIGKRKEIEPVHSKTRVKTYAFHKKRTFVLQKAKNAKGQNE